MDLRTQILGLLEKEENSNNEVTRVFDKDKYNELYDKINELVSSVMYSSYTTLFLSEKINENFDYEKIQNIIASNKVLEYTKVFVNLFWQEINEENFKENDIEDNIKIKIKSILDINILKNNMEIFSLIKSTCIYVIMILSKTTFEKTDNYDEFIKKMFNMTKALLEINKITCIDDEDELEGEINEGMNKNYDKNIFWI
jgi:hypothetical protein